MGPETPSITPTPCDLTGTTGTRCAGYIKNYDPATLTLANVRNAIKYKNFKPGADSDRWPQDASGNFRQHATTKVNADSRGFSLTTLSAGSGVVIGGMRFKDHPPNERAYGSGEDLDPADATADEEELRHSFFVFSRPGGYPPNPADGQYIGRWDLFQVYDGVDKPAAGKLKPEIRLVSHGWVRACTNPTDPPLPDDNPYSAFRRCSAAHSAIKLADSLGIHPFAKMERLLQQFTDTSQKYKRSFAQQLETQFVAASARLRGARAGAKTAVTPGLVNFDWLGLSPDAQVALIQGLQKAKPDPTTDSYWFSCGAGCCTADY